MGAVVASFDPVGFLQAYPEFGTVPEAQLAADWLQAGLYLNNTGNSPVQDIPTQTMLLNLLTAHIAKLVQGSNGQGASGIVGTVNSATEGSVSVGAQAIVNTSNQWYMQTPYGAQYWQATAQFRTFQYAPGFSRRPQWPGRFGRSLWPY